MTSRVIPSPLGAIRISEDGGAITEIAFVEEGEHTEPSGPVTELLEEAARQLEGYFRRERARFDLPLSPDGTDFQRRVWHLLDEIPFGETRTYQALADALASSARPVGQANGKNPLAIVVPCHRVVGTNGLTGYAGGLWRKQWLLAHEGVLDAAQPEDDGQRELF
jgi:methylated-DNA-[protein]-cysteine S-methyltransferase